MTSWLQLDIQISHLDRTKHASSNFSEYQSSQPGSSDKVDHMVPSVFHKNIQWQLPDYCAENPWEIYFPIALSVQWGNIVYEKMPPKKKPKKIDGQQTIAGK